MNCGRMEVHVTVNDPKAYTANCSTSSVWRTTRTPRTRREVTYGAITRSTARYPSVMDTTRHAPRTVGGLGAGTSNHRQPAPMRKPSANPTTILSTVRPPPGEYMTARLPTPRVQTPQSGAPSLVPRDQEPLFGV